MSDTPIAPTGETRETVIEAMRLAVDAMVLFGASVSERLAPSIAAFAAAVRRANEAVYFALEQSYAKAHGGKLPGSERTKRLRKKRRDRVVRWFAEIVEAP